MHSAVTAIILAAIVSVAAVGIMDYYGRSVKTSDFLVVWALVASSGDERPRPFISSSTVRIVYDTCYWNITVDVRAEGLPITAPTRFETATTGCMVVRGEEAVFAWGEPNREEYKLLAVPMSDGSGSYVVGNVFVRPDNESCTLDIVVYNVTGVLLREVPVGPGKVISSRYARYVEFLSSGAVVSRDVEGITLPTLLGVDTLYVNVAGTVVYGGKSIGVEFNAVYAMPCARRGLTIRLISDNYLFNFR